MRLQRHCQNLSSKERKYLWVYRKFNETVEKYVEMNAAYPFREGNERSTRICKNVCFETKIRSRIVLHGCISILKNWGCIDKVFLSGNLVWTKAMKAVYPNGDS